MIKRLIKLIAVLLLIASFAGAWYWNEYNVFLQTPLSFSDDAERTEQNFIIHKGDSIKKVARKLQEQHFIEHPQYFWLYTRLSKQAEKIKAGEYTLTTGITVEELVNRFVSGKVNQYALTIVEGWTVKDALAQINKDPNLVHTLDKKPVKEVLKKLPELLNSPYKNIEGLIYPDTYNFPRGTTDLQFIERAYKQMQRVLEQEWQQREKNLPLITPYEALILASIVEKESGVSSERSKIAGVFIRRIKKKMRLQSDPTIIYGMGDDYKGNIRRKDINKKTAYNTYQIDGLPPTPIAIPGREAIHAVLHPEKGRSLYFVADGSGGHVFTNNLKAHNKAVRKYILKKKN